MLSASPGDRPLPATAGLYRDGGEGWEWLSGPGASAAASIATSARRLGRFALLDDTLAPRIGRVLAPRKAARSAYSLWSLHAPVIENGSGLDVRGTYFTVDDRRVPSEWDGVRSVLAWRPLTPPSRGAHRWTLVARDRAGNERRESGTFVLD
jgi:hypothetical protein